MSKKNATAARLIALTLTASVAGAQSLEWSRFGTYGLGLLGESVDEVGDVNGDGFADVLVSDQNASPYPFNPGQVHVLSGVDGSTIHVVDGPGSSTGIGYDVAGLGDLDGDGLGEFAYTEGNGAAVWVHAGSNAALLWQKPQDSDGAWASIAGAGDVNGDNFNDLVLGTRFANGTMGDVGRVRVYSGRFIMFGVGPEVLFDIYGTQEDGYLGDSVDGAGDVNGDGYDDLIAGAPGETGGVGPSSYCGQVHLISGATGATLWSGRGIGPCADYGSSVAGAGDVNGDGMPDVIVGAPGTAANGNESGAAYVLSGPDGSVLQQHFGNDADDRFGSCVASAGDVNGDGHMDLLFGAPQDEVNGAFSGTAELRSGKTGALMTAIHGVGGAQLGDVRSLAGVGDTNGDGGSDFAVGSPRYPSTSFVGGRVDLWRGNCTGGVDYYCIGAANSFSTEGGTILVPGSLSVSANSLQLIARTCPPFQTGVFYYGADQIQLPWGDGFRCAGGATFRLHPPVQINSNGIATLSPNLTQVPTGSGPGEIVGGSRWNLQFWFRDPAAGGSGFNYTDAASVVFCP